MGFFIAGAFNPNPITDTADRQWLALDQSGFILPSHGMVVPTDSPNQPNRAYASGSPGNFAVPRFGWPGAYLAGYAQDVARDIVVTDWTPDNPGGYMFDSYGAIWPFGPKTPIAPTGATGAPFGIFPLPATQFPGLTGTTMNGLQMWSANGKPFGLGGYPDGFGYMISMDAVILNWGGPITSLRQPSADINTGNTNGVPGSSGNNCVRDFKVNPSGSGHFYVLFDSGYVYSGTGTGIAALPVTGPQADGGSGTTAGAPIGTTLNGWRWMHVEWGEYIVLFNTSGDTWGLRLTGGTKPIPAVPTPHPPWYAGSGQYYMDGDVIPAYGPSHFYFVAVSGAVGNQLLAGVPSISGLGLFSGNTTTQPTIIWTYADTLQVPQASYSVRVYKQSYINAQGGAFVAGQLAGTADGWTNDRDLAIPSDKVNRNLENGTAYRAYVRVKSAAGVWTAWSNFAFTLAIPVPATPSSCSTTLHQGAFPNLGTIDITAGGSLGAGETREFQVSAGGAAFVDVWGGESTTNATVTDRWPPTNVSLTYRVRAIKRVPGVVASGWTTAAPVVLPSSTGTPGGWRFIDVGLSGAGPTVILELQVAASSFDGQKPQGEFQPLTQMAKTVTTMGRKGDDHTVTLHAWDNATYQALYKMLSLTRPILFQNIFGRQWWVAAGAGTWKTLQLLALATETTGIRDASDVDLHLVQVNPPR